MEIHHFGGWLVGDTYPFAMPGIGRRLLVVEDEPLMASLLADALSIHGFVVDVASDVLEARQAVRDFDPDAALIDISLGDGPSGLDLARNFWTSVP